MDERNTHEENNTQEMRNTQDMGNTQDMENAQAKRRLQAKPKKSKKPFIIIGVIIVVCLILAILLRTVGIGTSSTSGSAEAASTSGSHIGVLHVEGEIEASGDAYNQEYALSVIDGMIDNEDNKALMLYVDSPGGSVYETDELYLKIKEYQETTGRPVYAYFGSEAASGGYYISTLADKILANRNCWTGSIGVTLGTLYNISGLLEEYGVEAETVASSKNKTMGSLTESLTDEQKEILQGLVNESYEQFVDVVATGRNMTTDQVKTIGDGRLYTAKQAKANGLIDEIMNTYEDAIITMKEDCNLEDCQVYEYTYQEETGLIESLIKGISNIGEAASSQSDISVLSQLLDKTAEGNSITLQYMSELRK